MRPGVLSFVTVLLLPAFPVSAIERGDGGGNDPDQNPGVAGGKAEREAIVAAANRAMHSLLKLDKAKRRGKEIPKKFWGRAIQRLDPVRVLDDRINVLIVLKEDELTMEGLYVTIPISSYAPGLGERFLQFEPLSRPGDQAFGELYRCKIRKTPEEDR